MGKEFEMKTNGVELFQLQSIVTKTAYSGAKFAVKRINAFEFHKRAMNLIYEGCGHRSD